MYLYVSYLPTYLLDGLEMMLGIGHGFGFWALG